MIIFMSRGPERLEISFLFLLEEGIFLISSHNALLEKLNQVDREVVLVQQMSQTGQAL